MSLPPPPLDIPPRPSADYPALRAELLRLITGFSSSVWTDYNTHDPGITLGEHFAYGITEGSYVAGLPMADLLTPRPGDSIPPSPNFPAQDILTNRPLTFADYRKLLIDQEGVRNAWLEEVVAPPPAFYVDCAAGTLTFDAGTANPVVSPRGFYRVLVEFEDGVAPAEQVAGIVRLRALLEAHRNLCEVFLEIRVVERDDVAICVDLAVSEGAALEELAAQVILALEQFLEPPVRFHSLEDRLAAGFSPEEIFLGPGLQHGFIDDDELDAAERPRQIRTSDLVQVLMDVPGVEAVRNLTLTLRQDGGVIRSGEPWLLSLDPNRAARFDADSSRLLFFKRELPFLVSLAEVRQRVTELRAIHGRQRYAAGTNRLPEPAGRPRAITGFATLLNQLPLNYGVGGAGLPRSSTPERQAQARQLKAYLFLLEQLLSGHRAQTARLPELLGLTKQAPVLSSQPPQGLRDFTSVTGSADDASYARALQPLVEPEAERLRRRHGIVDHLLSRFAESFRPYLLISTGRTRLPNDAALLGDKVRLLSGLPPLSANRAAALNLLLDPQHEPNRSGLEQKLRTLLGSGTDLGTAAEIFQEADTDGITEWRFRIRSPEGAILLSSSRHYLDYGAALAEIASVARQGRQAGRYARAAAADGRFYFNLADETGEVIARRIEFFTTEAARDAAIDQVLAFFHALPAEIEFYLLEHILVCPRPSSTVWLPVCASGPAGTDPCDCDDPYSFRVTVILPSRVARFRDIFLRAELERVIRLEVPAHVFVKLCWVDDASLALFRTAWVPWRQAMAAWLLVSDRPDAPGLPALEASLAAAQDALLGVWNLLRSEFPVATLHDCVDGNDENPVLLGRSTLGTIRDNQPS